MGERRGGERKKAEEAIFGVIESSAETGRGFVGVSKKPAWPDRDFFIIIPIKNRHCFVFVYPSSSQLMLMLPLTKSL